MSCKISLATFLLVQAQVLCNEASVDTIKKVCCCVTRLNNIICGVPKYALHNVAADCMVWTYFWKFIVKPYLKNEGETDGLLEQLR